VESVESPITTTSLIKVLETIGVEERRKIRFLSIMYAGIRISQKKRYSLE
jgi:hypothetical protein